MLCMLALAVGALQMPDLFHLACCSCHWGFADARFHSLSILLLPSRLCRLRGFIRFVCCSCLSGLCRCEVLFCLVCCSLHRGFADAMFNSLSTLLLPSGLCRCEVCLTFNPAPAIGVFAAVSFILSSTLILACFCCHRGFANAFLLLYYRICLARWLPFWALQMLFRVVVKLCFLL